MAARLRSLLGRLAPATIAESRSLAARLPGLLVEAREVAGAVAAGWHGRRQAGIGEDFWQFRPFESGEPVRGIDWRRSARGDTLYVREHERQNAHTVWLAVDVSASMAFRSDGAAASKCDRAVVLALALAELLSRAGERIGLVGDPQPVLSRLGAEAIAEKLSRCAGDGREALASADIRRHHDVIVLSDLIAPAEAIAADLEPIVAAGARAHLVAIADPVENDFPFAGRLRFVDPETGESLIAGRAETWREPYLDRLGRHRAGLRALAEGAGWTFRLHVTDRPAVEPLTGLAAALALRGGPAATQLSGRE